MVSELSRQILEQIAIASADGVIVIDASSVDYPITYVNPAFESLTGYSAEEAIGRPWRLLDSEGSDDTGAIAALREALGRSERFVADLPDLRKDGSCWLSRVDVRPIVSRRGELKQFLVMQAAASAEAERQSGLQVGLLQRELRRARQKAASLDRTDLASGLLRYEYFLELANRDCRIARRDRELVAVAVFEIVDLDAYEQTFGAKAADSCLRMIGAQVTGALRRASDLCGCDDDKRVLALTHGQDAEQLNRLADRIASNVRHLGLHNPRGRSGRYVTIRTGVAACIPSSGNALANMLDEARERLELAAADGAEAQQRAASAS